MNVALLGGAFDPPHDGHLALARATLERFHPERLVVLVADRPGHKDVALDGAIRLRLARAAFGELPRTEVELDPHAYTVETLREGPWRNPLLVIGADQLVDFPTWCEPAEVLERARLVVATRPGYPRSRLDEALSRLERADRVELFEIHPHPVSSREVRAAVAGGEPIEGLVPPAVAALVRELALYRPS